MGLKPRAARLGACALAMAEDRFGRLEPDQPLPAGLKEALSGLGRFDHLEIGASPRMPECQPQSCEDRVLCLRCGQPNEKERQICWACFKPLRSPAKASPQEPEGITVVLDGVSYRSSDPNLPEDVKVLIDRIREHGFSPDLLAQWRSWRATRYAQPKPQTPFQPGPNTPVPVENQGSNPDFGIKVFKGQRVSVIRLDGKVYTSDDKDLSPQMVELFQYIEASGVTPELMHHLRQLGSKATLRPATTPLPSDGDLAFWENVAKQAAEPAPVESDQRATAGFVLAGSVALYVLLRLIFGRQQ